MRVRTFRSLASTKKKVMAFLAVVFLVLSIGAVGSASADESTGSEVAETAVSEASQEAGESAPAEEVSDTEAAEAPPDTEVTEGAPPTDQAPTTSEAAIEVAEEAPAVSDEAAKVASSPPSTITSPEKRKVTVTPPVFIDSSCENPDYAGVETPAHPDYSFKQTGSIGTGLTVSYLAIVQPTSPDVELVNPGPYEHTFKVLDLQECLTPVTALPVTSADKCGTVDDTYTIPVSPNVSYFRETDGTFIQPGTYPSDGVESASFQAIPANDYRIEGQSLFTVMFTNVPCEEDEPTLQLVVKTSCTSPTIVGIADNVSGNASVLFFDKDGAAIEGNGTIQFNEQNWNTGVEYTGAIPPGAMFVQLTAADFGVRTEQASLLPDEGCEPPVVVVTPLAAEFVLGCYPEVIIPETKVGGYFIDGMPAMAGPYQAIITGETVVTFQLSEADIAAGFTLAEGAIVEWRQTFSLDDCKVVGLQVATSCGKVTFTNPNAYAIEVYYGDFENAAQDAIVEIAPGASAEVATDRTALDFIAYGDDLAAAPLFGEDVMVPQDCGPVTPEPPVTPPVDPPTTVTLIPPTSTVIVTVPVTVPETVWVPAPPVKPVPSVVGSEKTVVNPSAAANAGAVTGSDDGAMLKTYGFVILGLGLGLLVAIVIHRRKPSGTHV